MSHPAPAPAAPTVEREAPRPLNAVGWVAIASLVVVILANLGSLWVDILQLDLATDLRDGERVPFGDLQASDDRVATSGVVLLGAYGLCTIAFLVWFGRAYRNLERLGLSDLRWRPGWSIGAWFVPILNLFRPKQIANDIWRGSNPDLARGAMAWHDHPVPVWIHVWWALWLISGVLSNSFAGNSLETADDPDEFVSQATQWVVWDVVDLIPALLAIAFVWKTTVRQEERRRRFDRGEIPEVPPPPIVPPGWYDDPDDSSRKRYWDGRNWTSYRWDGEKVEQR